VLRCTLGEDSQLRSGALELASSPPRSPKQRKRWPHALLSVMPRRADNKPASKSRLDRERDRAVAPQGGGQKPKAQPRVMYRRSQLVLMSSHFGEGMSL